MHVTLDTNVFGPVASPEDYSACSSLDDCIAIAEGIRKGQITASISEASVSLEALNKKDRINQFFRSHALAPHKIILPKPSPKRLIIIEKALDLGITVMHVPRLGLGSVVAIPDSCWAKDNRYSMGQRQDRAARFMFDFPDKGPAPLKKLGTELVGLHDLDLTTVPYVPTGRSAGEFLWIEGLIAEYDSPKLFPKRDKFSNHFNQLISEWMDLDIVGSHYAYGLDYFCTLDRGGSAGSTSILHPDNDFILRKYNVQIVSPAELLDKA